MSEEKRAGVAVGVVICEARDPNRGGVRKRTLLSKRYRRRPSNETEHKLCSEDVLVASG